MAKEVHTPGSACVHDATSGCGGCKPTSGVLTTFLHPNRDACTGHLCAYLGGHRSSWPSTSTHRVVRASTTRPAGVVDANQCRGSSHHFCIPTGPRALAIRARTWVAIEVCGHRRPHTWWCVRPRRDQRVWWRQTNVGDSPNISASQLGRVHRPFVRVLGWPWQCVAIEVQTPGSACVHDATSGCAG